VDAATGSEAPTTRFASARNAVRNAVTTAVNTAGTATHRQQSGPPTGEREIESWLGELRGKPGSAAPQPHSQPPSRPAADEATTAIPVQRPNGTPPPDAGSSADAATRAIPIVNPRAGDTEAATEKLNSRPEGPAEHRDNDDKPSRRGGGGVSAQDLLRREGRI
jgi:RND superfamily putative drug exporter